MPCMYPLQAHLQLSPPDYLQQFSSRGIPLQQQYAPTQELPEKGVYEINVDPYGRKHLPPSFVRVSRGYHPTQPQAYSGLPPPGITHPTGQYYNHSAARRQENLVPVDEVYAHHTMQEVRRQDSGLFDQKPTGGVSAHLDYDLEEMTDFVGHLAQRLVIGHATSERLLPSYRKFVFQILSSTRLPSSTILLGLVYLRERAQMTHMIGLRMEHVYRLLTISLLLASKFLDDNTFQNKSWSEVTNIPVVELNDLEKEWLKDIKWNLHADPEGTKGFNQYKALWETWIKQNVSKTVTPGLASIDMNTRPRSHSSFSPVLLYPAHQNYTAPHNLTSSERHVHLPPVRTTPRESTQWWNPSEYSPPSAPETGPTTPEGFFGWSTLNFGHPGPASSQAPYSRLPPIIPPFAHQSWNNHPHGICNCVYCRQTNEGYFVPPYGQPITA